MCGVKKGKAKRNMKLIKVTEPFTDTADGKRNTVLSELKTVPNYLESNSYSNIVYLIATDMECSIISVTAIYVELSPCGGPAA